MRCLIRIGTQPVSLPLSADDIVEFHAARLLLLMSICGVAGRIDGLTKMAKLDFFARYRRLIRPSTWVSILIPLDDLSYTELCPLADWLVSSPQLFSSSVTAEVAAPKAGVAATVVVLSR